MSDTIRIIILLFIINLTLSSCSTNQEATTSTATNSNLQDNTIKPEFTDSKENKDILIKNVSIIATKKVNDISGITLTFDVEAKPEAFELIKTENYTGFFVDIKTTLPQGRQLLFRDELFKDKKRTKYVNINRDNFISSFGGRTIEFFVPFRQLELKAGQYLLEMEIAIFPVKYEGEKTSLSMRMIEDISKTPVALSQFKINIATPELYKVTFTVLKSKIDATKKDPSKYDAAISGPGYPDLFWEVYCGNDYIFYSPVEKNKTEFLKKYSTPSFFCTKEDVIHLAMLDYDNGPFNTQDDIIGNQKFITSDLKNTIDTLQFGKLEYLILQTQIEEIK